MIALLLVAAVLYGLCRYAARAEDLLEVKVMVKKVCICLGISLCCLCSVAFADDEPEAVEDVTPEPTMDVVPSLDDETDVVWPDEESISDTEDSGDSADTVEAASSDDTSDAVTETEEAATPEPTEEAAEPKVTATPVPVVAVTISPLSLAAQPENDYADVGDFAAFAVVASGGVAPYTYQWQYCSADTLEWTDVDDSDSDAISVEITEDMVNRYYRCIVTDAEGSTVTSRTASLIIGVPEIDENQYRYEVLETLGNIQGYILFAVVVILCFFVYKFLRIFF